MRKIASPQEVQAELRHFLAYCQGPEKPSRLTLVVGLRDLAARVARGYVLGPSGLEEPVGSQLTLQEGAMYALGASSSPALIIITKVTDDQIRYKRLPFNTPEQRIERWIGADLIERGSKTWLKTHGKHQPDLARSMASLLRGGKGRKEKMQDYLPVEVELAPAPGKEDQDLWYEAEQYGGVGGVYRKGKGGNEVMHYVVNTSQGQVEKIKNNRNFKVVKVTKR